MSPLGPPPLALSTPTAHLLSLLFSITYVGSLYISKHSRLSFSTTTNTHSNKEERERQNNNQEGEREKEQSERWRDDPDVIRARLLAVLCATTVCCSVLVGVVWAPLGFRWVVRSSHICPLLARTNASTKTLPPALLQTRLLLGFSLPLSLNQLLPHLITPILFLGPLFSGYLGGQLPFQRNWIWENHVTRRFCTWVGVRNYVVVSVGCFLLFSFSLSSFPSLSFPPFSPTHFLPLPSITSHRR